MMSDADADAKPEDDWPNRLEGTKKVPDKLMWCESHARAFTEDTWYAHAVSQGCPIFFTYKREPSWIGACPD